MDLNKLRHAVVIAREGSFSAAAAAIPMSQPALTRSIQSLEDKYGITLFERGRSGVRLTPDGERLVSQAQRLLQHSDRIEEELRGLTQGHGAIVQFGIGPASAFTFLPGFLPRLLRTMPDVHVNIRIGSNTVLHELLQRREIEFYIGGVPLDSDNFAAAHNMSVQPVAASSGLRLMVREGHPLLGIGSIRERMPEYPVVAGTLVRDTISKTDVLALGIQRPTIEIDDYSLLTNLVRNSDAILVTSSIFNHERTVEGLVALSEGVTMSRPVTYALMSSGHQKLSTAGQRVATFLADSIERSIEAGHARSNEGEQR